MCLGRIVKIPNSRRRVFLHVMKVKVENFYYHCSVCALTYMHIGGIICSTNFSGKNEIVATEDEEDEKCEYLVFFGALFFFLSLSLCSLATLSHSHYAVRKIILVFQNVATYAHHVIIQMMFYCHNVDCTQFIFCIIYTARRR